MRAHVVLPEDLVKQIDSVAGRRKRSRFVEQAVREKLSRAALGVALRESAGVLDPSEYPEWGSPEAISEWVRASRRLDEERLARKLGPRAG